MSKKILITGISGFVGSNLANKLSKNKNFKITGTYFKNKPKIEKKYSIN